jgi:hypothetical protein
MLRNTCTGKNNQPLQEYYKSNQTKLVFVTHPLQKHLPEDGTEGDKKRAVLLEYLQSKRFTYVKVT